MYSDRLHTTNRLVVSHVAAIVGRLEPAPPCRVDSGGLSSGGNENFLRSASRGRVPWEVLELRQPVTPEFLKKQSQRTTCWGVGRPKNERTTCWGGRSFRQGVEGKQNKRADERQIA